MIKDRGFRCPSEHLALTWDDVDWENDRMTVHAPKTKRYEGKESRLIPIFSELRPYLEAVFNERETELGRPPSSGDHVISR
jgi:integrase